MPFWTLFWLIAPAVALLAIGTWISVGRDTPDHETPGPETPRPDTRHRDTLRRDTRLQPPPTHEARNRTDR